MALTTISMADRFRLPRPTISVRGRRHRVLMRTGAALTDTAVISLSVFLAYTARAAIPFLNEPTDLAVYLSEVLPALVVVWVGSLAAFGGYSTRFYGAGTDEYRKVQNGTLTAAGITGTLAFLTEYPLSRSFFVLLFLLGVVGILLGRLAFRKAIQAARRSGHLTRRVLLAGAPVHIDEVAQTLQRESWLGLAVVGAMTARHERGSRTPGGVRVLGTERELAETVTRLDADLVIFAQGSSRTAQDFRRIAWELEEIHVSTAVVPALTDISHDRIQLRPMGGLPLVHVEPPRAIEATRFRKRLFDILAATAGLVVLAPALAVVALVVKLHDGGPVIFRQVRIGRDGKPFNFLKFRSMVPDAERIRAEELETDENTNGVLFKIAHDPRVTGPGRFFRRYSIDELPQLINVLRGDMSLVGPRPALPQEVDQYDDDARRRLRVRPGLTGLWQVSGRSDLPWDETVRLDVYYVDNWSFMQDLSILAKTVRAVFSARGAY